VYCSNEESCRIRREDPRYYTDEERFFDCIKEGCTVRPCKTRSHWKEKPYDSDSD
jgi:hypothetical protein